MSIKGNVVYSKGNEKYIYGLFSNNDDLGPDDTHVESNGRVVTRTKRVTHEKATRAVHKGN